jgi:2'-5' RNA ligase
MKRKIFISINIPGKVKKRLVQAVEKWKDLPVKWVKSDNFHVTLFFLGYIEDETTRKICDATRKVAEKFELFDIEFNEITLDSKENPKTIWLTGPHSEELMKLCEKIEKELGIFSASKKSFRPHITLGRIRKHKWEVLENKPGIEEKIILPLSAETIDVMASKFEEGSNEYAVIEACPLK